MSEIKEKWLEYFKCAFGWYNEKGDSSSLIYFSITRTREKIVAFLSRNGRKMNGPVIRNISRPEIKDPLKNHFNKQSHIVKKFMFRVQSSVQRLYVYWRESFTVGCFLQEINTTHCLDGFLFCEQLNPWL